jgi:hypothetical protein
MDGLQHAAETKSSNGSNRSKRSSRPRLTSEIFWSSLQITDNLTAVQPEAGRMQRSLTGGSALDIECNRSTGFFVVLASWRNGLSLLEPFNPVQIDLN